MYCQVDGCTQLLDSLKEYHQRYKVCEEHLKTPYIIKDGVQVGAWCVVAAVRRRYGGSSTGDVMRGPHPPTHPVMLSPTTTTTTTTIT